MGDSLDVAASGVKWSDHVHIFHTVRAKYFSSGTRAGSLVNIPLTDIEMVWDW